MASITKRGPYQFQVQIRRKGYLPQIETFESKREAEAWATVIESEMHRGVFVDRSEAERTTFGEVLERYAREVTPNKRGYETEMHRINALKKHPLAARFMASHEMGKPFIAQASLAARKSASLPSTWARQGTMAQSPAFKSVIFK